jgi:hypothetical protein
MRVRAQVYSKPRCVSRLFIVATYMIVPGPVSGSSERNMSRLQIERSQSHNRGSYGACTHTAIVDHGNPGAWPGTPATAPATAVPCANGAFRRVLGALDSHEFVFGGQMCVTSLNPNPPDDPPI